MWHDFLYINIIEFIGAKDTIDDEMPPLQIVGEVVVYCKFVGKSHPGSIFFRKIITIRSANVHVVEFNEVSAVGITAQKIEVGDNRWGRGVIVV